MRVRTVRRTWKGALLAGLWALAAPSAAHAAPAFRLVYVREAGTESCPEEVELRMSVAARLGYDPFSPSAGAAVIARVGRTGERLTGSVEIADETGISRGLREIEAAGGRCDELARALSLSVSIAIDPERALGQPEAETERAPARGVSESIPVFRARAPDFQERDEATSMPVRRRRGPHFSLGGSGAVSFGLAPSPAYGGSVLARLSLNRISFGLDGRFARSAFAKIDALDGAELSITVGAASPSICLYRSALSLCGVGAFGVFQVESQGIAEPRSDQAFHAAAGAALGFEPRLSDRVRLLAQIEVLVALTRPEVKIDGREVWAPASWVGAGRLGLLVDFP